MRCSELLGALRGVHRGVRSRSERSGPLRTLTGRSLDAHWTLTRRSLDAHWTLRTAQNAHWTLRTESAARTPKSIKTIKMVKTVVNCLKYVSALFVFAVFCLWVAMLSVAVRVSTAHRARMVWGYPTHTQTRVILPPAEVESRDLREPPEGSLPPRLPAALRLLCVWHKRTL